MSYLSYFQGSNFFIFPKILVVTLLYTFPLGYAIIRFLKIGGNPVSRAITAWGFGIPATAAIWSLMTWLGIPFKPLIYLAVILAVSFPAFYKSSPPGFFSDGEPLNKSYLWMVIFLLGFSYLTASYPQIDSLVPGGTDGQLHGYLQVFLKYTGRYTPLKLYPELPPAPNYYPPGFQVISVMSSLLTGTGIARSMMGICVAVYVVLSLFLFEVAYKLTGSLWAASLGVALLSNRIYLFHLIYTGQFPELLALLGCLAFFYGLTRVLQKNDWRNVLVTGLMLGACGTIHSRFLLWLSSVLLVYLISRYLAEPVPTYKEQRALVFILLIGLVINIPLFYLNFKSTEHYSPEEVDKIYFNLGKHYSFLRKNGITHIFVPKRFKRLFERQGIPDFIKKEHQVKDSVIYRVL